MILSWQKQFTLLLTKYYAPAEAARASSVLLPAILNVLTVKGRKMKTGKKSALVVTDLFVADVPVQFDSVPGFGRVLILEGS